MKFITIIIGAVAIAAASFSFLAFKKSPRIAVVRTGEVLDKFVGMRESKKNYEVFLSKYRQTLDSMKNQLDKDQLLLQNCAPKEKMLLENRLIVNVRSFEETSLKFQKITEAENNRLTAAAINQFNSFVQQYSKDKGYDVVLGVTLSGNILYSGDTHDVTEEITEAINKNYLGK